MKIEVDGFSFDFTDAIDAFVFDEKYKSQSHYHGLSQAMKAVDIIVELDNDYLFIEVKDFHAPDDYNFQSAVDDEQKKEKRSHFNHLLEVLKYKYRDTWLYRWAENKTDKPIRYLCLLTLDNALISALNNELRRQLPIGNASPRWNREIARSCVVVNIERFHRHFPNWQVTRLNQDD
ncbi:MAG: hypothetical protein VSS75_029975 [Candidatus Parabeggiatoa sp.]|nr:hypothetical protein [Candidatus Parabeggiatoa sp.]